MDRNRLLLLTPPLLQPNCPYPATMHLTGFLEERGFDVHQRDLSIKVVLDVLREHGGDEIEEFIEILQGPLPIEAKRGASEIVDELALWIRDNVDPDFGFSRYAEHIAVSVDDFGEIEKRVRRRGVMDRPLERHLKSVMEEVRGGDMSIPGDACRGIQDSALGETPLSWRKACAWRRVCLH